MVPQDTSIHEGMDARLSTGPVGGFSKHAFRYLATVDCTSPTYCNSLWWSKDFSNLYS